MRLILHVQTLNKKTVVIAAVSSRPYLEAAVNSGFDVIAIDAFADQDTQRLAQRLLKLNVNDGLIDGDTILNYLSSLEQKNLVGFCYGAGFEMQPELLDEINQIMPVIGNSASVLQQCKDPKIFFKYCNKLGVPYPNVSFDTPTKKKGWLKKTIGSHGGMHIRHLEDIDESDIKNVGNVYFQQFQMGQSVSCLFFVSADAFFVIGFNEQWSDGDNGLLYRYGGAVSQIELSDLAKFRFTTYVSQLAKNLGLVGLNSCDAICDGDDIFILEINPRLSASIDLYRHMDLLKAHIDYSQISMDGATIQYNGMDIKSCAHKVVYSDGDLTVDDKLVWPEWVSDIPKNLFFSIGEPICTVHAAAKTALLAKQMVNERATILKGSF